MYYIRNRYIYHGYFKEFMSEPLTPAVFHILLALSDQERHGYAIIKEVSDQTNGAIKLGAGTLYGTIKRLLESGWIEESDTRPDPSIDDERRRYYRITPKGHLAATCEAERLEQLVRTSRAKKLLPKLGRAT